MFPTRNTLRRSSAAAYVVGHGEFVMARVVAHKIYYTVRMTPHDEMASAARVRATGAHAQWLG